MTSNSTKILHDAIHEAASPAGFRKKGSSWYCKEPEAILVISPQKSQYGLKYFLNLAIFWRIFGDTIAPKEQECHLRGRIESTLPQDKRQSIERSLDFEDSTIDDITRHRALSEAISLHAIPVLKRCATKEGLREEYKAGRLKNFLVAKILVESISL